MLRRRGECYARCPKEHMDLLKDQVMAKQRDDYDIADLEKAEWWAIRLRANVYGRRPARAAWRQLFEEMVKDSPGFLTNLECSFATE